MDESNQALFNKLRITGPIIFFVIVFGMLFKLTELGAAVSFLIAATIAIADYFVLTWLMSRIADTD